MAPTSTPRGASAPALCAVSRPRALARGHLLTKASPILQFEPAMMLATTAGDAKTERPREVAAPASTPSPGLPVIRRIVRHTLVDRDERAATRGRTAGRYGIILVAALLAAALGALAGIGMREITPVAAAEVRAVHR